MGRTRSRVVRIAVRVLLVLFALGLCGGGFLWWRLRSQVEPIPEVLAEAPAAAQAGQFRVPGLQGQPALSLSELRGKRVVFVIEGRDSMKAKEGRVAAEALDRWELPADVSGYMIGELEGLGFLSWKINDFLAMWQQESRFPVYADYEGTLLRGFKMPKGHSAVVVVGPDGSTLFRHSGALEPDRLQDLRTALGAQEPVAPDAGPFAVGSLSSQSCRGLTCAFVFLGEPVERARIPGIDGGFDGDDDDAFKLFANPTIRLVAVLSDGVLPADAARGVFVGELSDVPLADGWERVPDSGALRAAFELPEQGAAVVVVDPEGRVAFREIGHTRFTRLQRIRSALGIPEEQR